MYVHAIHPFSNFSKSTQHIQKRKRITGRRKKLGWEGKEKKRFEKMEFELDESHI